MILFSVILTSVLCTAYGLTGWHVVVPPTQLSSFEVVNELEKEYLITFNYKTLSNRSKISIGASGVQPYSSGGGLRIYFMVNGSRQNFTIPTTLNVDYLISIFQERESNKGTAIDFIIKVNNTVVFTSKNINAVLQSDVVIISDSLSSPNSEYSHFTVYKGGPPRVSISPEQPKEGNNVTLSCVGNFILLNVSYRWLYNGQLLDRPVQQKWRKIASRESVGSYSCQVNTSVGIGTSESTFLTVPYKLYAPDNLRVHRRTSSSLEVKWKVPSSPDQNQAAIHYNLYYGKGKSLLVLRKVPNPYYNITGLTSATNYSIHVSAVNSNGEGVNSSVIQERTDSSTPTVVRNLTVVPSYYNISVTWAPPLHVNGQLVGYTVSFAKVGEQSIFACRHVLELYCYIKDISPSQPYIIQVTVTNKLFNTSKSIHARTLNVSVPPKFIGKLPLPKVIDSQLFSIQLITFQDPIKYYDVVVKEVGTSPQSPNRKPNSYSNAEIANGTDGLYVAGRLFQPSDLTKEFIIGDPIAPVYSRNISSLAIPTNRKLKQNIYYSVFVRGYADTDVYQSSPWYTAVKTKEISTPLGGGSIALIVVVVVVLIAIVFAVLYIIRNKSHRTVKIEKELEARNPTDGDNYLTNIISGVDNPHIPVHINAFEDYVYELNANGKYSFSQQYAMITRELDRSYDHSRHQDNNIKNRYHNVPAYDDTRVLLQNIDNDPHSDYINANFIQGFQSPLEYIATQGPLPETVFDFWRMAWEYDVSTIIMLTKLQEKCRLKCAKYWPDQNSMMIKDIVITSTDVESFPDHIVRTFHVTRIAQAVEKVIKQFHFIAWPDFGVPEDPSALLCFIRKVDYWKSNAAPAIVHCSAGVGRTGTYITIDTQLKNVRKHKEVDIFNNVCEIRRQRCLMVQTEDQFIFIHNAILASMDSDDTEVEASGLSEYINLKSQVDPQTGMSRLFEEFIKLAKTDKKDRYNEATKSVNMAKNRYKNICPYDDTRVSLQPYPALEGSDYINANFIDSYLHEKNFIATQAPLESTASDFWRMAWEQKSDIIVMILKEADPGMQNFSSYFPHEKASMKIGYFIIELGCETTYGDYIEREIKVTNTEASSSRKVKHFQFTSWPDSGLPENGLGFVELIGQVRRLNDSLENNPIIIHCRGGVGPTGVFIALSNLIERVKMENVIDVYTTVKKMRLQRTAMVQTKDQYEFCYRVVQEFLASFDLYANFSSMDSMDSADSNY